MALNSGHHFTGICTPRSQAFNKRVYKSLDQFSFLVKNIRVEMVITTTQKVMDILNKCK